MYKKIFTEKFAEKFNIKQSLTLNAPSWIKKTKHIVLSSQTFNSYFDFYNKVTHTKRLILPKWASPCSFSSTVTKKQNLKIDNNNNNNNIYLTQINCPDIPRNVTDILGENEKTRNWFDTNYGSLNTDNWKEEKMLFTIAPKHPNLKQSQLIYLLFDMLIPRENNSDKKSFYKSTGISQGKGIHINLNFECFTILVTLKSDPSKKVKWPWPFSVLPFFYSVKHEDFLFFLSKILNKHTDMSSAQIDFPTVQATIAEWNVLLPKRFQPDSNYFRNLEKDCYEWKYDWIIQDNVYTVELILPKYKCMLFNHNKSRTILFELIVSKHWMIEMLTSNFDGWEDIAWYTLSSYSDFRLNFNCLNSRTFWPKKAMFNWNEVFEPNIKKKTFYGFFITFNYFTSYVKLFSYQFEVDFCFNRRVLNKKTGGFTVEKTRKLFFFESVLEEMKRWFTLKSYFDLKELVSKCLIIDNCKEHIAVNSDIYNNINEQWYPKLEPSVTAENEWKIVKKIGENIIKVNEPRIEWRVIRPKPDTDDNTTKLNFRIQTKDEIKWNSTPLGSEFITKIGTSDISNWSHLLVENQNDFSKDIQNTFFRRRSFVHKTMVVRKDRIVKMATITKRSQEKQGTVIATGKRVWDGYK